MRITEQVGANSRRGKHPVESLDVKVIPALPGGRKRRLHDPPARELQAEKEWRVDRRVDDDAPPGGVIAWMTSLIPVITSGIAKIKSGSGDQPPRRSAANSANASPRLPLCA